jgi:RNA polymerase sigma factor (TIGR02999 family)
MSNEVPPDDGSALAGDKAAEELIQLVYYELRLLARQKLANEAFATTLQPTALVHEAWLRLLRNSEVGQWQNRAHFFGAAANAMRCILIDRARKRGAPKHGGGLVRADEEAMEQVPVPDDKILLLVDAALEDLRRQDPEAAMVVECKFFLGMNYEEIAAALDFSKETVGRRWITAKAWLRKELGNGSGAIAAKGSPARGCEGK